MNINESESNWDFDNAESNNYAQNRKSVLIKKNNQVVDYLENWSSIDNTINDPNKSKPRREYLHESKTNQDPDRLNKNADLDNGTHFCLNLG